MEHDKKLIEEIAIEIGQNEYGMSDVSNSLSLDWVIEVASIYYEKMMGVPTIEDARGFIEKKARAMEVGYDQMYVITPKDMTEFAEQKNRERIEHALKAQSELMDRIERYNNMLKEFFSDEVDGNLSYNRVDELNKLQILMGKFLNEQSKNEDTK